MLLVSLFNDLVLSYRFHHDYGCHQQAVCTAVLLYDLTHSCTVEKLPFANLILQ